MEKRIGVIGIVIEELDSIEKVNEILHEFVQLFIGRMGVPYREKGVSVITLIVDGTVEQLSALTGKLGRLAGVNVKSMLTKN